MTVSAEYVVKPLMISDPLSRALTWPLGRGSSGAQCANGPCVPRQDLHPADFPTTYLVPADFFLFPTLEKELVVPTMTLPQQVQGAVVGAHQDHEPRRLLQAFQRWLERLKSRLKLEYLYYTIYYPV
jgi:hypothetical protein